MIRNSPVWIYLSILPAIFLLGCNRTPETQKQLLNELIASQITTLSEEPFTFSISNPTRVQVSKTTRPAIEEANDLLDPEKRGLLCLQKHLSSIFPISQLDTFFGGGVEAPIYIIFDPSRTTNPKLYGISLLPNNMSLSQGIKFRNVFEKCENVSDPLMKWDNAWLLFGYQLCGKDTHDDQCTSVKNDIERSLQLTASPY